VLVAEDNRINQMIVGRTLGAAGHAVVLVGDGAQAVAAAAREPFDVVLMDVQMPTLDGLEATRRIRALPAPRGRVPVIALTANSETGAAEACRAAGMNDYLAKPIDPTRLLEKLAVVTTPASSAFSAAAPTASENGAPRPVDPAALELLAAAMSSDELGGLVASYLDETARRLGDIAALSDRQDFAAAAREAHALISMSGGVGAMQVSALARAFEQACLGADIATAGRLARELQAASDVAADGLRSWLGRRGAS
jgi:CheY-like chemotaxis protein